MVIKNIFSITAFISLFALLSLPAFWQLKPTEKIKIQVEYPPSRDVRKVASVAQDNTTKCQLKKRWRWTCRTQEGIQNCQKDQIQQYQSCLNSSF